MIRPRTPRREELGAFLRARRLASSRASFGLPPAGRRVTHGLSREEVAALAGVSGSWYTWLEQGRDTNVSRSVLLAVARVLALSEDETSYVLALAEREDPAPPAEQRRVVPAHLQHLVDALDFPAFVVRADWAILGWNAAYAGLYPRIATVPEVDRNLLRLVYTDPGLRAMLPDWERDSRRFLAEFRAEAGPRLSGPAHRAVVERLTAESAEFRAHAAELEVSRFESRHRSFHHPTAGPVTYEHHRLVPSDATDLHVVMYAPLAA